MSVGERLKSSGGGVVGESWLGVAGASAGESVTRHSAAYVQLGGFAKQAGAALGHCADRWQASLDAYRAAHRLGVEAVREERDHLDRSQREAEEATAAGDEARASVIRQSAETYVSPLRSEAQRKATAAVADFNAATREACGALDSLMMPAAGALGVVGAGSAVLLGPWQRLAEYASENWMRHVPGQLTPDGRFTGRHVDGRYVPPGGVVPDKRIRGHWAKRATRLKVGGHILGFTTASTTQWLLDHRKYPGMDTDEQVGRAATAGIFGALGGWLGARGGQIVGAGLGAGAGTLVFPGAGTAVGGVAGGVLGGIGGAMAGGWVAGKIDDPFIDAVGNLSDRWDRLTPW